MPDQGALPNLLVLGAMKCGTSSLHYYLGLHPEIEMSQPKELHFFLDESDFDPDPFITEPGQLIALREQCNWDRGIEWYAGHFSAGARVRGESTVAYSYPWFPGVAERISTVLPENARLLYVVRDPVERMISHYLSHRQVQREHRSVEEALGAERNPYKAASSYGSVLRPFRDRFAKGQILLVRQDELLAERRATMGRVFEFLGVDPGFWSADMETVRHRSAAKGRAYLLGQRLRASRAVGPVIQGLPARVKVRAERLLTARPGVVEQPRLDARLDARLRRDLEPDIRSTEELTDWNLDAWRQPVSPDAAPS